MYAYILLAIGFFILIKGAVFLVEGATSAVRLLRVSDMTIGLTVVAFGTSAPELFVNIIASIDGNTDIAIGNILGSNILNILLVLGIAAIMLPFSITKGAIWKGIPLSLLAAILLGILANDRLIDRHTSSVLTRIDGLVLISFFIIFLGYAFGAAKRIEGLSELTSPKRHGPVKMTLLIVAGLIGLSLGAKWTVEGGIQVASSMGISQSLIGLTLVAIGTSLPELAASLVAVHKKNLEIAVGNVIGSNIFNIFFILGLSGIIRPLTFQAKYNADIGVLILASLLLFITMFSGKKHTLDRWEGIMFVLIYIGYIAYRVYQG